MVNTRSPKDSRSGHTIDKVKQVQQRYTDVLMEKKYVIGVGIGLWDEQNQVYGYCLVVMVSVMIPESDLDDDNRIPDELDGVPVKVKALGIFRAH